MTFKSIVIGLILFLGIDLNAQIIPASIDYITINPETNELDIYWNKSTSPLFELTIIYKQLKKTISYDDKIPVDTSFADTNHFRLTHHINPDNKPDSVRIASKDTLKTPDPMSAYHTTVHLKAFYDSCRKECLVNWTPYIGWTSVKHYEIWQSINNSGYTLLQTSNENTYTLDSFNDTSNYCFYIAAVRNDGVKSLSNKSCFRTQLPLSDLIILPENIQPSENHSQWNFSFNTYPSVDFVDYKLVRASEPFGNFDSIAIASGTSKPLYSDGPVIAPSMYYQSIAYRKNCPFPLSASPIIKPIFLIGEMKNNSSNLQWDYFPVSQSKLERFDVFVVTEAGIPKLLVSTLSANTQIEAKQLEEYELADQICFYISCSLIHSNPVVNSNFVSNKVCFKIETEVTMPDAFTPNSDGVNDIIFPTFNRNPIDFVFLIFDRWGKKVFETASMGKGWDGTIGNIEAPEGIYLFQVKGTGFNGKKFEKNAYFSLIYP